VADEKTWLVIVTAYNDARLPTCSIPSTYGRRLLITRLCWTSCVQTLWWRLHWRLWCSEI